MSGDQALVQRLQEEVTRRYAPAAPIRVVRSPYRICPLGAHIDHQHGIVTAMAIDQAAYVAFSPTDDRTMRLSSLDFPGEILFSIDDVPDRRPHDWGNFARGAVRALQQDHALNRGICGVTAGRFDGGGLSSSAAIGVALLLALEHANGLEVSPVDNIALDLAIENDYLGLRIGILDQSAILLSQQDCLTVIDCQTTKHELISAAADMQPFSILIAFSGLKQALVSTDYNLRVEQCASAASTLLQAVGRSTQKPHLRNVTAQEYHAHRHLLKGPPARRANHYFTEMERVQDGVAAWRTGDLNAFGALMSQSGRSSIINYECGCEPLIDLYEILVATPGILGARFSGAGFRGCCVALVAPEAAREACARVEHEYRRKHPDLATGPITMLCRSADGARLC